MNKIFKHIVISYDETKVKQQFESAMLCRGFLVHITVLHLSVHAC